MRTFDDTGKDFLSNYIRGDYASILPTLEERHAVLFGKASSCENPVLLRLNDRDKFLEVFRAAHPPAELPSSKTDEDGIPEIADILGAAVVKTDKDPTTTWSSNKAPLMFSRLMVVHFAFAACALLATPALALDLNSFRAQHGRPALSVSSTLSALAYEQAHSMAARTRLDHAGFRVRVAGLGGGMHAENVAFGCDTEDCAIRMWARSGGHRANMLRGDVSAYGIASATGANGRRYWALELGN